MAYNYDKLKGKIVEKCGSQKNFAKIMGLSERSITLKLNNRIHFTQDEISKAAEILGLANEEIQYFFFDLKVH